MHLMLIATATGVQTVARWRHAIATPAVTQIKDRAKSIKFTGVCDNSAKPRGKRLLHFRSKQRKGQPEDCKPRTL
jgi:hypothetical protein